MADKTMSYFSSILKTIRLMPAYRVFTSGNGRENQCHWRRDGIKNPIGTSAGDGSGRHRAVQWIGR
jgi:hypothetical protein